MRWTNKQGNLQVKDDRGQILTLWRSIAQSNDDTKFTESVEKMKLTDAWLRNPKAQQYFIRTWLSVAEKWTNRFFKDEYDIKISTNNGVETQNKVIKSFYLKLTSDKSLNSTIETIIDQFLPESLKKYHLKNLKLTGEYKKMSNVIPNFLHRRPEPFVKHIYNRLSTAQNIYSENKIKKLELEHTFHVKSEDGTCVYTINFLIPNCTCIDYIKFHWPCKHLCAIFLCFRVFI